MMNFDLTPDQQSIRAAVQKICDRFPESYWLERDRDGVFPHDFYNAMGEAGWLGTAIPEEYGGSGLGVTEAAIVMQTIAESGACMSGASSIHINMFGLLPVVVFGTEEQKRRMLPPMVQGKAKSCFAVTEPNTGLNTTKLKTRAVRQGDKYVVHGQKVWISTAQVADKMLLLARTTPIEELGPKDKSGGLSLFYTDLDRSKVSIRLIEKMGRKCVDSNELFIDGLEIPVEDRIGEEGKGFKYILHGMNPEHRPHRAEEGHRVRQGAGGVRPPDRHEPVNPASLGGELGRAGGGDDADPAGRVAVRPGQGVRRRSQRRQVLQRGSGLSRLRTRHSDARRNGLLQGIPCRALPTRDHDPAHRARQPRDDPESHRRARAGPAQVLLKR
jgi:hypothetical protein